MNNQFRNENSPEVLSTWEKICHPEINYPEFGVIEQQECTIRFKEFINRLINKAGAKPFHNIYDPYFYSTRNTK